VTTDHLQQWLLRELTQSAELLGAWTLSMSVPKKRRLKIDTGAGRVAVLVPADGTVADACEKGMRCPP
jgi:hypothetical protein